MPTPTLGKVPTRVLVTTAALACLVSVRLVLLGMVIPEPLLVTPEQAVLPPPGLVVTLAPPLVTLAVTRERRVILARVATRAVALIRALAMGQDLMAPQTSMSTSLALFPCAPCLLATSIRAHLRQLKLIRALCLVLPLPC